jgi:tetratricopeptide (TPR) repeat protein
MVRSRLWHWPAIALLKDDIQTADENLKRAATKGKKMRQILRQRGESYLFYVAPGSKKASLTRCEELLKEAVEINSKDYATLMALAYCYKEMPDGGRSALNYEYAELADPKNPLPKLMLALVYKAAKVPEKPLQYFDKAIAAQANFTPALRGKADYLYFARKWEDATKAYKELVAKGAEVVVEDEMQLANCLFITKDCVGCAELVAEILAKDGSEKLSAPSARLLRLRKWQLSARSSDTRRVLQNRYSRQGAGFRL